MKNCNCDTEINRDGSGQLQRYLKALDPSYAPIDGRSTEDLLVFAKKYAAQIRFYDIPESKINDSTLVNKISWREFFRRDMAVIAASISLTHAEGFKKEYDEVTERLQFHPTPDVYAALYAPIVGMIKKIDRWYSVAIPENPLYTDLKLAIDSDLKQQVQKIMAYEEGFKFVDPSVDLKIDLNSIENKEVWGLNETVPPDATIYTGTTQQEKILSASLFTEDIFHAFYNFLSKLIKDSEKYMHFAMEQYPAHQPHMALFITFLQLFSKAQEQMNGLTGRLLDFYYKEVLHLETKPSVPDKAHIVFELAKDVAEYDLAAGTALKAGSDKSGKEQVYKTTDDLVVNQATVKELKTIFVEKIQKGTTQASQSIHTIYARPVANSSDGLGEKFPDADTKWPTFGIGSSDTVSPKNACDKIDQLKQLIAREDQARVGFAIASPQLLMQGGKRLIEIKLDTTAKFLFDKQEQLVKANNGLFEIWFTGDKEWFKVDKVMSAQDQELFKRFLAAGIFNPLTDDIETSYYFSSETDVVTNKVISYTLHVYLPFAAQAVVGYNAKLHAAYTYSSTQPVMQVMINPVMDLNENDYKSISASNLSLKVKVGSIFPPRFENRQEIMEYFKEIKIQNVTEEEISSFLNFSGDGLSKLVLQNESQGLLPAGKPFDPFTAYPNKGKSFYIGTNEVFNKPLGQLAVSIKKTNEDDTSSTVIEISSTAVGNGQEYEVSILENRTWVDLSTSDGIDFVQRTLKANILNTSRSSVDGVPVVNPYKHPRLPILPVAEWKTDTEKGFLRLTNLIPVTAGNNSFQQASQNLAPFLEIKEVSVSYESALIKLDVGVDEFYHVYPFGTIQTYLAAPAESIVGVNDVLTGSTAGSVIGSNTITKIRTFLGNNSFAKADQEKNYLLVNAGNLLLPQFTYLSPYDQYNTSAGALGSLNTLKKQTSKDKDTLAGQLILNASGLVDKITGGANQYSGTEEEEGMLFIGIEKAQPLQMVSMLFQFAEGSAADEDSDPPEIHWSYLTNNEWRPLKEESIVSDGTVGFQTTGIVKIEIPEDATNNNTIITTGLYWLCASVTSNSNRIPMLIDVVTQAVLASFVDNNNDQSHFDSALAAGSISKLSQAVAQISKVQQPFASFDGKHKEIGKEFYTRASERLRHKGRAITPWDYEHLVLDRFPSIYKVKCITHTDPNCLCREPEKAVKASDSTVTKGCGISNVDLTYSAASGTLDDVSAKALADVITKMKAGTACKIKLTGYVTKDNTQSAALAGNRLDAVAKELLSSGVAADRFSKVIVETGEKNMVSISEDVSTDGTTTETPVIKIKGACCGPQIAPGHVLLIPISNLKNRNAVNPLQPKTSRRILLNIEAYLKKCTSPFVHVHAKNPVYEQVLVFFRVKFREGYDKGFYMKKLNDEIVHYLTPWAFDDISEIRFDQKIYASSIINFIEERVYVDFITDFLMIVCRNGCCDEVTTDNSQDDKDVLNKIAGCRDMEILLQDQADFIGDIVAEPSTARSLLVSAARHIIIPYQEPEVLSPCQTRKLKTEGTISLMDKDKLNELLSVRNNTVKELFIPASAITDVGSVKNTGAVKSAAPPKVVKTTPVVKKQRATVVKKNTKTPKNK